jgi:hypothetical protein
MRLAAVVDRLGRGDSEAVRTVRLPCFGPVDPVVGGELGAAERGAGVSLVVDAAAEHQRTFVLMQPHTSPPGRRTRHGSHRWAGWNIGPVLQSGQRGFGVRLRLTTWS